MDALILKIWDVLGTVNAVERLAKALVQPDVVRRLMDAERDLAEALRVAAARDSQIR